MEGLFVKTVQKVTFLFLEVSYKKYYVEYDGAPRAFKKQRFTTEKMI